MSFSPSEHHIKKSLESRQIAPSKNLWDNIEQELDKASQPKKPVLWFRITAVAAVLCLIFLVYQGLKGTRDITPQFVIQSEPAQVSPITIESEMIKNVIALQPLDVEASTNTKTTAALINKNVEINEDVDKNSLAEKDSKTQIETSSKVDKPVDQDVLLTNEVNALLAIAMENTTDPKQKEALIKLEASLLLAEAESDVRFEKPKEFEDKIWDAIVSNFQDIKKGLNLN
jgi:hypothetical protein